MWSSGGGEGDGRNEDRGEGCFQRPSYGNHYERYVPIITAPLKWEESEGEKTAGLKKSYCHDFIEHEPNMAYTFFASSFRALF